MNPVLGILLGTLCSAGTSLCLGIALFRKLGLRLDPVESIALSLVVGAACYSQLVFLLCAAGLATPGIFAAVAVLAVAAAAVPGAIETRPSFPGFSHRWVWLYGILFAGFGAVYLANAMAPEMSPDGSVYHLPVVIDYLRAHGFDRQEGRTFYGSLSQGIELLFLPAYSLGQGSAAAMVHFVFFLDLPLLMVSYGRRFGFPLAAAAAAFLVFASPVFGWDGTSAYNDVAVAAILFALYYLLQIWDTERVPNLLIAVGILAGFSYAAKYSAAVAVPYAAGYAGWRLWKGGKPLVRPLATIFGVAALFILPWMIKNAIFTGNPVAPFANRLFPNPYVHVSFEQQYRCYLRRYLLPGWLDAPWELAVKGEKLQGFVGPVFLLLPLGLVSVRRRQGRALLLAGAVFALPWLANVGTRFLIPAMPLFTLAFALALRNPAPLLPAIAIMHAFLSWYAAPIQYFDHYAPRLTAFPLRAALRMEPESSYLARSGSGYRIDRMIEAHVPPGEKVFSFEQIPDAWTTREILAASASAGNEVLSDVLRTPLDPQLLPSLAWCFHFAPQAVRRLRAVQTGNSSEQMWSISEFQILAGGVQIEPAATWHSNANPNRWDVPLAFDGRPVTRWRSWERARPGMFVEVDLGRPQTVDEVRLPTTPDARETRVDLYGMDSRGAWRRLGPGGLAARAPGCDLRLAAIRTLLSRGIRYLLVSPGVFGANEFFDHPDTWGIQREAETDGRRLYRLTGVRSDDPSTAEQPPAPEGAYDDTDDRIRLQEPWTRDTQFLEAAGHTLTYTNIPGASFTLRFAGDSITYVYTSAVNRGIAEVAVDGEVKGRLDLYSAETRWRQRASYDHLGPGPHELRVRVTGEKNPKATGCFADLDELIVE